MLTGFSKTKWGTLTLPFPLAGLGMPGCTLYVSPIVSFPFIVSGGQGVWTLRLPSDPTLVGLSFFNQALVLDAQANPAGAVVSNAAEGIIGAR